MRQVGNLCKIIKLIDEFLVYLNTKKEAYQINKSFHQVKLGQTNDIEELFDEL